MSIRRPSPAMVVACIALFVALGGTGIAAVNYARNAGKVDGKSAFKASRSRAKVAGGLVATYRHGVLKGQIAHRFLAETPLGRPFGRALDVADNAQSVPVPLVDTGALGSLTTTCTDQNPSPGIEDPESTIAFSNQTSSVINVATRIGAAGPTIGTAAPGTQSSVTIRGSNTFEFQVNLIGTQVLVEGVVRQDGARSPAASCLVYGTSLQVTH
jgi:hypothetical protein